MLSNPPETKTPSCPSIFHEIIRNISLDTMTDRMHENWDWKKPPSHRRFSALLSPPVETLLLLFNSNSEVSRIQSRHPLFQSHSFCLPPKSIQDRRENHQSCINLSTKSATDNITSFCLVCEQPKPLRSFLCIASLSSKLHSTALLDVDTVVQGIFAHARHRKHPFKDHVSADHFPALTISCFGQPCEQ